MNDKMLDIIGLADEKYLHEAQGKPVMKQTKHRRKLSAKVVAIAAAAAVMTVTAGAVAVTKLSNKKSVEYYYNEKMASDIEQKGYAVGQVTQNEHIKMTLETLMVDDYSAKGIVTVEFLDDTGIQAFNEVPQTYALDENGKYLEGTGDIGSAIGIDYSDKNGDYNRHAYTLGVTFGIDPYQGRSDRVSVPDKIKVVFTKHLADGEYHFVTEDDIEKDELDGLCFEISTEPNVKTLHLQSQSGHKAVLTPSDFSIQYSAKNVPADEHDKTEHIPQGLVLHYKDGTTKTLKSGYNPKQNDYSPVGGRVGDEYDYKFSLHSLVDTTKVEYIETAGEIYR